MNYSCVLIQTEILYKVLTYLVGQSYFVYKYALISNARNSLVFH